MDALLQPKSSLREQSLPALGFQAERGPFLWNRRFALRRRRLNIGPLNHSFADRLASVRYFSEVQYGLSGRIVRILAYNRNSGRICSGIKLYSDWLNVA
jgi:hypothetical protein